MRDINSINTHRARFGSLNSGNHAKQRGLSFSAGAYERYHFSGANFKAYAIKNHFVCIVNSEVLNLEH